ncbi:MAG: hypothetical protein DMF72_00185 [Acidobacteria bacterium]|nr:MAG: hypothetical protein DMF72_00185 [Acidobacteriota bacterium]
MHNTDNVNLVNGSWSQLWSGLIIEAQRSVDWFCALPWWAQSALVITALGVLVVLLQWLGVGNWLLRQLDEFAEDNRKTREKYEREEELRRDKQEQERTSFHKRRWTREEAALEIKKYNRELERADITPYHRQPHLRHLSIEEIHQRIDFLEAGHFHRETRQRDRNRSYLSDADRKNEYEQWCDRQRKKQLDAILGKDRLTHAQQSHMQYQRLKRIENYWEDKKFTGPPNDWDSD